MSWVTIPVLGGYLKIKPRRQLRFAETNGNVPLLDLGIVCISYWSRAVIEREQRATKATAANISERREP